MKKFLSIKIFLVLIIFSVAFFSLLMPIGDPDFFWHMATGKWIFENHALPSQDPFSFTTPKVLELRDQSILKGYWLSQVIFYISYLIVGGWNGIIFLRISIIFLLSFFLIKRKEGDINIHLFSVLITLFCIFNFYFLDRPQVFSFLFFAILLYLIDTIRKGQASFLHYLAMPLLMILWSNIHPGYILGQFILFIYLVSAHLRVKFSTQFILKDYELKRFSIWSIIAIISAFLNPLSYNTWLATFQFMHSSDFTKNIIEYSSTIEGFFKYNQYIILFYWLIALVTIISIIYRIRHKGIDFGEIFLTVIILYFSFTQVRYVAFFFIWATPFVSYLLETLLKEGYLKRIIMGTISALILFIEIYWNGGALANLKHFIDGRWLSPDQPSEVVRFIKTEGLQGNMYNFYDWGGYLIWELGPERKVFIDGRGLHSKIFSTWLVIENATDAPLIMGKPYWRAILDSYNINYAVLPIAFRSGLVHPLIFKLLYERDWVPVLMLGNQILFVRDIPEARAILYKYSIPKANFIDDMIYNIDWQIGRGGPINLYIAKGELYLLKNDLSSAELAFRKVLEYSPFNTIARNRLNFIETMKRRAIK